MDYAKMITSVAGGMQNNGKTKSTNPEAAAMLGDVGVALDENDRARDKSYRDAFTNYMEGANRNLAEREMAAGAAANAAANAAGPAQPQMATGAAMPANGQIEARQALQAQMARAAMGQGGGLPAGGPPGMTPSSPQPPQHVGAPGPSRALQGAYIDPSTGLGTVGTTPPLPTQMVGAPGPSDQLQQVVIDPRTGLATIDPNIGVMPQMNDAALQAAYLRSRGM